MIFFKRIVCVFSMVFFLAPLFAEYNSFGIPDSSEIRKKIGREWFEAPIEAVRDFTPELRTNTIGIQFQVRSEEQGENFLVIVAPKSEAKINVYDSKGMHTISEPAYNVDSAGSWLLVRDKRSGAPVLARYYFAKDTGVYVQFRPNKNFYGKNASGKESSFADMIIFDSYAARAVPLGIPFEKFYTASFAEIQALTKKTLPWKSVVPEWNSSEGEGPSQIYGNAHVMIQTIRDNLKDIVYVEDAIYDEAGDPISLQKGLPRLIAKEHENKISLCSQGFVKWGIDGIIEPLAGSYLKRNPLLVETVELNPTSYQGNLSEGYNIYHSLDWTRNLAAAVLSVTSGKTILYAKSGVDVKVEPFAASLTEKGIVNTAGYVPNSGYKVQYLKQLLYVLAATNPEYFYLAAVRQSDSSGNVETRVFNKCAMIFPYFDSVGAFRTVVFCDGQEFSLQEFCNFCKAGSSGEPFIHLTRVKTTNKYYPQTLSGGEK